jgi:hypothetical protein
MTANLTGAGGGVRWNLSVIYGQRCWTLSHVYWPSVFLLLCFFFYSTGFDLRASHVLGRCPTTWATSASPVFFLFFFFFWDRVLRTICTGWLWTAVLLISVSWVARIIGVILWHLLCFFFWELSVQSVFPFIQWVVDSLRGFIFELPVYPGYLSLVRCIAGKDFFPIL